jgi:HEAT repeat protein
MIELQEDLVEASFARVLVAALSDRSAVVRQLAVEGLWEVETDAVSQRFLTLLRDDESLDVRAAAAQGLAPFAERAAEGRLDASTGETIRSVLVALASSRETPYLLRRRALESVATFGRSREIDRLITEAFDSDDPGMRAGAVYAMGRSLDRRWVDVLAIELEGDDVELRYEAAVACGKIGDDRILPQLILCADDDDVEVRQAAIQAIGQIGGRGAATALRKLLERSHGSDAEFIESALEEALIDALP